MGKRIKLSNGRRLVDDVIHMANKIPLAGMSATLDVTDIAKLRRMVRPKISWNVLFMKAYAQVAVKRPSLRQCYVSVPWGYLYQHDYSVCMMTIGRQWHGEERLLFARFNDPANETLLDLQAHYDVYRKDPVDSIKQFRHQITFAKTPSLVRKFAWWSLFNLWPQKRASHMGTFGMSFSGNKGAFGERHLGPNTTTIGIDPFPRKGQSRFLITFDHRVLDGNPVTELITETQKMLNRPIRRELAAMAGVDPVTFEKLDSQSNDTSSSDTLKLRSA
jgi:hypothetical protein